MDSDALQRFAAYCREHKITFDIHYDRDGSGAFRLNFSAENDEDVQELLKFLKGDTDDTAPKQPLLD